MTDAVVHHRPAEGQPALQLMLLFHGFGATPADLATLAGFLASAFPQALIVGIAAPTHSHPGEPDGRQWFSPHGLTDDDPERLRPARVAEAMPAFEAAVRHWQRETGLGVDATALVGFSQGAIMALESTQRTGPDGAPLPALGGRTIALAGRFATLPLHPAIDTTFHLFHGKHDPVMPYRHAVQAAERLVAIGADVTADVLPFVQHEITAEMMELLVERLQGHVPRRLWQEAMRAAGEDDGEPPRH